MKQVLLLLYILTTNICNMGRLVTKKKPRAPPAPGYVRGPGGRDHVIALLPSIQSPPSVSAKIATPSPPAVPLKRRRDGTEFKAKRARFSPTDKVREMGTEIGMITANMMKTDTLSVPPVAECIAAFVSVALPLVEQKKAVIQELSQKFGLHITQGRSPTTIRQATGVEEGEIVPLINLDAYRFKKDDISVVQTNENTINANQYLAIKRIDEAMVYAGTVVHATCALFKLLMKPKWGIVASSLGMVRSSSLFVRVKSLMSDNTYQMLHRANVWEKNTNKAIDFQNRTFFRICPAMPSDFASGAEKRQWKLEMKEICQYLKLKPKSAMERRAYDMSEYKRECDANPLLPFEPNFQRKEPSHKMYSAPRLRKFKAWLISKSDSIVNSPDQRDMKQSRDLETGKLIYDVDGNPVLERKYYYKLSLNRLWLEATQLEGGYADFRKADGKGDICVHRTTMDRMVRMLGCFKLLTESQSRGCLCVDCLNGQYLHQDT